MTLRLSQRAAAIKPSLIRTLRDAAKPSSLDLGIGQTDLPFSDEVAQAVRTHVSGRRAPYGPNLGLPQMRQAVATRYGIDSEEVMITCGVQEGLAVAIHGLVNPGDEVLIPDPSFPAYANLIRSAGATPVAYPLTEQDFDLAWSHIEPHVSSRTRAILINTPGNPTGCVHDGQTMCDILHKLVARGIFWISDEIYEDYVYEGEHVSPADDEVLRQHGVRLSGLSKSHHLMGWRLGWLTAPAETVDQLKPLHQHLVTSAPTIVQHAGVSALAVHDETVRDAVSVFRERRELVTSHLSEIPGLFLARPRGAFYIWLNVHRFLSPTYDSMSLAMSLLQEEDVVSVPGMGFGPAGRDYLRLAYTIDKPKLEDAMARMRRFFARRTLETI